MDISEFGLENAPDPSSTNECEEFSEELEFDEIAASTDHAKPRKGIYAEHWSKVWRIDMESAQKTLNVTTHKLVRTENPKLTRNFNIGDRMLRYKHLRNFSLCILSLKQIKLGNNR